jgi:predicted DNA-binding protein
MVSSQHDPDEYVSLGEEVPVEKSSRKSAGIVVSARFEPQVAELLVTWSEREGKRISQLVREAVIAYLSELENPKSKFVFHTDESTSVQLTGSRPPQISYDEQVIQVS